MSSTEAAEAAMDLHPVVVLGSTSSGKSATLRAMVGQQGRIAQRDLIFSAAVHAQMRKGRPATFNAEEYEFQIANPRSRDRNPVTDRFLGRFFDPTGGAIDDPTTGLDAEVAQRIRTEYKGSSLIIVCLSPRDCYEEKRDLDIRLNSLSSYVNACTIVDRPPFIAVCFTKADEYGVHYSECGRLFQDKRTADGFQEFSEAQRLTPDWSAFRRKAQVLMQARYAEHGLAELVTDLLVRTGDLALAAFDRARLFQSCNFYLTAAAPHVSSSAQIAREVAGKDVPYNLSAGLTDMVMDWQRWVFDQEMRLTR